MKMNVKVGISNRHVHLTLETYKKLFGDELKKERDLNQIGEFVSNKKVNIKTSNGTITNVRILGPLRDYDQVEISRRDALKLGINPPIVSSGELAHAEEVTLVHGKKTVKVKGCIIALRHLHMNTKDALKLGVKNKQKVKIIVDGKRGGVLEGVVKVSRNGYLETHIDTDEAAAFSLVNGDDVTVLL